MNMASKKIDAKLSVDDRLTAYMNTAEEALIGAVTLFAEEPKLERRTGYLTKLVRAQEMVTSLHREELVRARGPLRPKRRR